jgi:hypothetical protein
VRRPLAIDLFCGLGGWAEGFLAEGYDVVGFDIERHVYGEHRYPAQLVLQDVLTLHGSQFRDAAVIVASPPCQAYSYRAMPWKRAKALPPPSNELFEACYRIRQEAATAKEQPIPLIIENVQGAQPWVGRAAWHYGSFYLWGDVPALMPPTLHRKVNGFNFHAYEKTGKPGGSFQSAAVKNSCTTGGSWFNVAHNKPISGNQSGAPNRGDGLKQAGLSGPAWFDSGAAHLSSHSPARKAASAIIAKIPFELAAHIARIFKPAAMSYRQ